MPAVESGGLLARLALLGAPTNGAMVPTWHTGWGGGSLQTLAFLTSEFPYESVQYEPPNAARPEGEMKANCTPGLRDSEQGKNVKGILINAILDWWQVEMLFCTYWKIKYIIQADFTCYIFFQCGYWKISNTSVACVIFLLDSVPLHPNEGVLPLICLPPLLQWGVSKRRNPLISGSAQHPLRVGHAQALRNWGANSMRDTSENRDQDIFLCYTDIYSRYVSWTTVSSCTWHPWDLFYSWNLYLLTHPPFHLLPTVPQPSSLATTSLFSESRIWKLLRE